MPTFKSTCPITTGLLAEIHGELSSHLLRIAILLLLFAILLPMMVFGIPRPISTYILGVAVAAAIFVHTLWTKYSPPITRRLRQRRILKAYGTPAPTLESRIEGGAVITRILETGREHTFPLHGSTVMQTAQYIFIRPSRKRFAAFVKSDFSEEVLAHLLATLEEYGADVLPFDEPQKEEPQ